MVKKFFIGAILILTSSLTQASLIEYNGYSRDSSSNIVTGGGLEWLMWDVTKGLSINSALDLYSSEGWRLASNVEMAFLFNSFEFGNTDGWNAYEESHQFSYVPWNSGDEHSPHAKFIKLFGATRFSSCASETDVWCYSDDDPFTDTFAFFGSDVNDNGRYHVAFIRDDFTYVQGDYSIDYGDHAAVIYPDWWSRDHWDGLIGVSLVRTYVPDPVAVPTPSSIGLLALGLIALGYRRRQVIGR